MYFKKIGDKIVKAETNVVIDGQFYKQGDEIWDLGSFQCTDVDGQKRSYEGFSTDVSKLPKYENLATGSSALCYDTGDYYKYHAPTKTWNLLS